MGRASAGSLLRRLAAKRAAPKPDDPADMGTAFGLEASLGPVSAFPRKDEAAAELAVPGDDPPMGWLGRRPKRRG